MKRIVILLLFPLSVFAQDKISGLDVLSSYMTGSFHSAKQAEMDTNYLDIRLDMHRIWKNRTDGVWLYVEQALNKEEAKPYRQRVYHLEEVKNLYRSSIYEIDSALQFTGLHKDKSLEAELTFDRISKLDGCAIELSFNGSSFVGATKKGECKNSWGKATYATSEVEIFSDKLISWDRGWNAEDEYVWGAEKGGYHFLKK